MSSAKYKLKDEEISFLVDNMVTHGYDFVYNKIFSFVLKEFEESPKNLECLLMNMYEEFTEKARSISEYDEREHEQVLVTKQDKSLPLASIYYDLGAIMRKMAHYIRQLKIKQGKSVSSDKRFLIVVKN